MDKLQSIIFDLSLVLADCKHPEQLTDEDFKSMCEAIQETINYLKNQK